MHSLSCCVLVHNINSTHFVKISDKVGSVMLVINIKFHCIQVRKLKFISHVL